MIEAVRRAVKPLADRVQMMVGRAVVAAVNDGAQLQELQLELLADETIDAVEHCHPYGFSAHPKPGAEAVMLAAGGLRSHGLVLSVFDRRYRMRALAEGEVALHDDQGQSVLIGRDGIVITSPFDVTIDAQGDVAVTSAAAVSVTGETVTVHSDNINLGAGGGAAVARVGDPVSGGHITAGSSKVRAA